MYRNFIPWAYSKGGLFVASAAVALVQPEMVPLLALGMTISDFRTDLEYIQGQRAVDIRQAEKEMWDQGLINEKLKDEERKFYSYLYAFKETAPELALSLFLDKAIPENVLPKEGIRRFLADKIVDEAKNKNIETLKEKLEGPKEESRQRARESFKEFYIEYGERIRPYIKDDSHFPDRGRSLKGEQDMLKQEYGLKPKEEKETKK